MVKLMTDKELLRRLTNLEIQVAKLTYIAAGTHEWMQQATNLVVGCAKCDKDPSKVTDCPEQDCPCGLD